ncbi:hypothetical protein GCM10010917_06910 [Paenibacillus physcomitrellae]|uniref:Uncharacterized protein n=1 Tax=Paenibacillus physcomitrellae TaxID=1619311 RepID=A0ABQ1FP14_9BACL|nr:hypothetical protein GCM10010917_06910 [Paenibacillus physcomitrellae]
MIIRARLRRGVHRLDSDPDLYPMIEQSEENSKQGKFYTTGESSNRLNKVSYR